MLRRVSERGSIMVATRRIHVGMIHARKIVTISAGDHSFRLDIDRDHRRRSPHYQQRDPPLQGIRDQAGPRR
jgi:hypothetical protein